jgi:hypothetical protein
MMARAKNKLAEKNKTTTRIKSIANSNSNSNANNNQNINIVIKTALPKSNNTKVQNNFPPSIELCNFINSDNKELNKRILTHLEYFNEIISSYLYKTKINVKEIENKLKKEELMKENEILSIRKNLEDKVESVLDKANSCLENIRNLGKNKTNSSNSKSKLHFNFQ